MVFSTTFDKESFRPHLDFATKPHVDSFNLFFTNSPPEPSSTAPPGSYVYTVPSTDSHFGRLQVLHGSDAVEQSTTTTSSSAASSSSIGGSGGGARVRVSSSSEELLKQYAPSSPPVPSQPSQQHQAAAAAVVEGRPLLGEIARHTRPAVIDHPRFFDNRLSMEVRLEKLGVETPFVQVAARRHACLPSECRAKGTDYTGRMIGTFRVDVYKVDDSEWESFQTAETDARGGGGGETKKKTKTTSKRKGGDSDSDDDDDDDSSSDSGDSDDDGGGREGKRSSSSSSSKKKKKRTAATTSDTTTTATATANNNSNSGSSSSSSSGEMYRTHKARVKPRQHTLMASYRFVQSLGPLPVMVRSLACNLRGLDSAQLVRAKEEPYEAGGYYIVNGTEKLARLIISQRRNTPFVIERDSFARQEGFTRMGCLVKCVRPDETIHLNQLHYAKNGTLHLAFGVPRKYIPVAIVLKALKDTTDREIFQRVLDGSNRTVDRERMELSLIEAREFRVLTRTDAIRIIGQQFQFASTAPYKTDLQRGQEVLDEYVLPFISTATAAATAAATATATSSSNTDKFDLLVFMVQKLLKFVNGEIKADDLDSIANHEALTPGVVLANIVSKALDNLMAMMEYSFKRHLGLIRPAGPGSSSRGPGPGPGMLSATMDYFNLAHISSLLSTVRWTDVATRVKSYLATGNVPNMGHVELPQQSGLVVVAEKLNFFRFISHFRGIHRGAAFTESRSNDVRRLKVDAWGYICPAHSPDGHLSGLLNHLTHMCEVSAQTLSAADKTVLQSTLYDLGVSPLRQYSATHAPVFLDGSLVGSILNEEIVSLAEQLRHVKLTTHTAAGDLRYRNLEIAFVPKRPELDLRAVPGLFLLSHHARFMRPVRHLQADAEEMIGPTEQLFLHVAVVPQEIKKGITTHMESDAINMFSNVAALTPFSDFNQSPRNVYQCQMGKQTMGIPMYTYDYRTDNKIYRITSPQAPISRTALQDKLPFDDYLTGTNCIVAVLSYTGYDMEDAMIINRASYERGLHHGGMYQTQRIDLLDTCQHNVETLSEHDNMPVYFRNWQEDASGSRVPYDARFDMDGMPKPGTVLDQDDVFFIFYDEIAHTFKRRTWSSSERGIVDNVKIVKADASGRVYSVMVTVRQARNPVIGDKFSSRHGQKGVLSLLWPQEDMPFTEHGMTPDIIINPHAFPSRMTIGMLIESMASKSGALHGYYPDATPFHFDENYTAVEHYGAELRKAGFNYYGNEVLYSGVFGTELKADIFIGAVYYQRLRHMVADKFQARATGPVNRLTHQPVHGRKKGGGVRLGEMERDGILAYGASYMLRDRLFHNSDESFGHVCRKCGNMLGIIRRPSGQDTDYICKGCGTGDHLAVVEVPYVFKLLSNELAACNIGVSMKVD